MLQLIEHIVRTSARRDRTEINESLVDAIEDLFDPISLTIYRAFPGAKQTMLFDCAGIGPEGRYLRNAYLPESRHCHPIESDPLWRQAVNARAAASSPLPEGGDRLVFPLVPAGRLLYLLDISVPEHLSPAQRTVLLGLVEYSSNHMALLDYGETDTLTGLPNRKTFDKHLFEIMAPALADDLADSQPNPHRRRGSRDGRHWLAVCDIDHFKAINDTHGHLIGDEVLIMFAHLMRDAFRFQDQLFRFGGEEFVVVLQPSGAEAARAVFDRFRRDVENHPFSRVGRITVSIGYSQLLGNDTPSDVIDRADEALYYVKQHGRNAIACYEELVGAGHLAVPTAKTGEIELF